MQEIENYPLQLEQLSPLQRAFVTIKEMRGKLDAIETAATEPIAIVGMGCKFPGGANDPESFWQILRDGVDTIREVPADRWNIDAYYNPNPEIPGKTYTRQGGFLDRVDEFDAEFFGIHPREATSMDPQQRLLLEVSWQALENAGIAPGKLTGSQSGVFVGLNANEYAQLALYGKSSDIDVYAATGNALSVAAGRLSYNLGLQGPALTVDTACSSSLVAVHLACSSLRSGECNLALVGGVFLMLSPLTMVAMSKLRALSPDGRCKTFDAKADGYGRGEGCGIIILKRFRNAIADGDNIQALIRGSAVNQDGHGSGLTVPNAQAQQAVIRAALENAKVAPADISYVEAHGTGTSLGDPIEVKALTAVLGNRQPDAQPLMLGSVKTNIGHLEPAAGIASLMKVVLAMQHQEIPPHLHFTELNPHISQAATPVIIPTKLTPWLPATAGKLFAGVSSFGFSGTNSHLILESVSPTPNTSTPDTSLPHQPTSLLNERPLHLLALSAKTETALEQLVTRYQQYLEKYLETHPEQKLADICFTANTGRSHFTHRQALVGDSLAEIAKQLANVKVGAIGSESLQPTQPCDSPKIAFFFPGQGCEYINMGRELFETQPTFRKTLERCDEILRPYLQQHLQQPLLQILYPEKTVSRDEWDETTYNKPHNKLALFSIEYALAELWKSWGIEPDLVIGDGVGEYVAACVAEVFTLEDGLKLIAEQQTAAEITYSPPSISMISNLTGKLAPIEAIAKVDYWQNQIGKPVKFSTTRQTLSEQGIELFVEISPTPTLIKCLIKWGTWLPSLDQTQADWQILLSSLATAYMKGAEINWEKFDRDYQRQRIQLPTYPFQRQRYWVNIADDRPQSTTASSAEISHPLLDKWLHSPLSEIQFESQFVLDQLPLVGDHRIDGMPLVNLVVYLEMVFAGVREAFGEDSFHLENLSISQALIMPEVDTRKVQLILIPESEKTIAFKIFSLPLGNAEMTGWMLHLSGKVCFEIDSVVEIANEIANEIAKFPVVIDQLQMQYPEKIPSSEFYHQVEKRGIKLGKSCQLIDTVWRQDGEAIAKIKLLENQLQNQLQQNPESDNGYLLPLGSIDAWIQILSVCFPADMPDMYLLVGLEKFYFYGYCGQQLWGKAKLDIDLTNNSTNNNYEQTTHGNLWLFDETGVLVAEIINVELKRVSPETLRRAEKASNSSVKPRRKSKNISTEKVFATAPKNRPYLLEKYLIEELAIALQLSATKISLQQPLAMLVDSLMAYELRNRIEADLQVKLPMEKFLGENNIAQLAIAVVEQLTLANLVLSESSLTLVSEDMEEIVL